MHGDIRRLAGILPPNPKPRIRPGSFIGVEKGSGQVLAAGVEEKRAGIRQRPGHLQKHRHAARVRLRDQLAQLRQRAEASVQNAGVLDAETV